MIIDILDKYPTEEQDKIIDMAERWYVYEYRQSGTAIDLYGVFNDAPYWGDGKCEKGTCKDCKYDTREGDDESCDNYIDENYNKWFDGIISEEEIEQIKELRDQDTQQKLLFVEDDEWKSLHIDITYDLMKWLNKNDVTYCIIRGIVAIHDEIYVKGFYQNSEYKLRFGSPSVYDMKFAVDEMGWKCYDIYTLTNISANIPINININPNPKRNTEIKQTSPTILDNSRVAQFLISFYKRWKGKIIHYLRTSSAIEVVKDTKTELYFFPVKTISIIVIIATAANVALSFVLHRQIALGSWLIRGLFLFLAVGGLFCKADWPTVKENSVILEKMLLTETGCL